MYCRLGPIVPGLRRTPEPYYPNTSRADQHPPSRRGSYLTRVSGRATPQMMQDEGGRLLTATEVAEMLHLHVNTVKRLGDRGELPFFRVVKRGDRRFRYSDVVEFLHRAK